MNLFPHQVLGVDWLISKKFGVLADDMGLGKTLQAIAAAKRISARRILVVCRAVARRNWEFEFQRFHNGACNTVVIESKDVEFNEKSEDFVLIVSYEGLRVHEAFDAFDLVIVDESHFVKNSQAKRSAHVFGKKGVIRKTKRLWCLTATPCPNNFSDLWLCMFVFGATKLTFDQWARRFCFIFHGPRGLQITGSKDDPITIADLKGIINPFLLRREITEVQLPPISFDDFAVEPGPVDVKDHFPDELESDIADRVEKEWGVLRAVAEGKISDEFLSILQATAGSVATLRKFNGLQKVAAVVDLLKGELSCDKKLSIVLFAIHRSVIEGLCRGLSEFGVARVWGGTSNPDDLIRDFQAGKRRVFVGQTQAAGTSITLTRAHEVIMVERAWTPADNSQAWARVYRIGQTHPVRVRNIVLADDPIEWRISSLLNQKETAIAKLLKE